jgi:hypothetical protein
VLGHHFLRLTCTKYPRLALTGFVLFACGIAERHVEEGDVASDGGAATTGGRNTGGRALTNGGVSLGPGAGFATGGTATSASGGIGKGGTGAFPYGGKSFGGMPPIPSDCSAIPVVEPVVCGANANSAGETGASGLSAGGDAGAGGVLGTSSGTGGAGGGAAGANRDWCVPAVESNLGLVDRLLIDDLEDGDDATPFFLNGRGAWFVANDGSGQQFPLPCTLPSELPVARNGSRFAMRTYGQGFSSAPGAYSLLGISVKSGEGCGQPLDATGYTGIEFWARGSGTLRFFMGTVETNPPTDFGTCASGCYDAHGELFPLSGEWEFIHIPFTALHQEGWGAPAAFDPAHILTLQWSAKMGPFAVVPASCFDFLIDDVALYR